jgi:phosphoserine aminotransferase
MFQGGATLQFSAICYNLLSDSEQKQNVNYLCTGLWSQDALKEGKKYCETNQVATNDGNYSTISDPEEWNIDPSAKFFHYCSNETIQGLEFHDFPFEKVPEG